MIRLDRVSVRVGQFDLQDISLEVPRGGYALILGPTGTGTTTLLEAVAGHAPLRGGRVFMHDDDVTQLPPERRGLGFVYQQYHLFPHLSVRDNIGYGITRRGNNRAAAERTAELADMLGILPLLDRPVRGLSGGEQQRVALARALAPRPSILLLDEPFASIDPATRHVMRRELRTLHEREGITTLQ
ncbi:MAG: ABC transporter ATP-binding protein, partial [Gemmatimonadales bacterium]